MASVSPDDGAVLDVVGVGFGPANLALAIAVREHNASGSREQVLRAGFLERQPCFGWHRGMLIDGATMQVSFLKDLVTMRNPSSAFSFLCYLHDRDRLADFINQQAVFPSRVEFHDYLEWAAARFTDEVDYDAEVVAVRPVQDGADVVCLDVVARGADGRELVRRTRNLVLAQGLRPALPVGVEPGERVWHSSELLPRLDRLDAATSARFVVVGGGQSAAEAVAHLHGRFRDAQIHAVLPVYGYQPADDSPFVNRVFDPAAVDEFHDTPPHVRQLILDRHRNTNYAVVDGELITHLFRTMYQERVRGPQRLHLHNLARVVGTRPSAGGVDVDVRSLRTETTTTLRADVVIYATGYQPTDPLDVLGEMASSCKIDGDHGLLVGRDHRVVTAANVHCGIYVQGSTEHLHGLSSTLLSTVAVRAGELVRSLTAAPVPSR